MIRDIKNIINSIIIILALIILIAYAADLLIGANYALDITFSQSSITKPLYIHRLPLYFFTLLFYLPVPIHITLTQVAFIFILIYVIFLSLAITRKTNILDVIRNREFSENDSIAFITYISISLFLIIIVEFIQEKYGIKSGVLGAPNEYIRYVSALIAPLIEELGFRLTLIGIFSLGIYLISCHEHITGRGVFISLWRPYEICSEYIRNRRCVDLLYIMIIISGFLFGLEHYLSGGGWDIGKISTATIAGVTLGYLYIKNGFHSSVLGHTYYNVFLLSMYYIGNISKIWFIIMELIYFLTIILGILTISSILIGNIVFRQSGVSRGGEIP